MNKLLLLFTLAPCLAFGQTTLIPNTSFELALLNLGYDNVIDGSVLTANISGVDSLNVSSEGITDLTGIEDFAALTWLDCNFNVLTSLDVSNNTALTWLECGANLLTCLNVKNGNNTNMTYFYASNNPNLTCIEVDDSTYSTANWTNIDFQTSFSQDCNNACSNCSDITINDTTTNYVSTASFMVNSPLVLFDSTEYFTTIGGCDSTLIHYTQFVYDPSYCTDTTEVFDTTYVTVTDTNWVNDTTFVTDTTEVFDTTYVTVNDTNTVNDTITYYDTVLVSVTDTLIIDVTLTGVSPPNNTNTLKVYPNPAKDQLYIDNGDYLSMSGYTLKIVNSVGQDVFSSLITIPLFVIDISTFPTGLYFIQVIDGSSNVLENKKLVLE